MRKKKLSELSPQFSKKLLITANCVRSMAIAKNAVTKIRKSSRISQNIVISVKEKIITKNVATNS